MADFDFSSFPSGQALNTIDSRWKRAAGNYWPGTDGQALAYPETWTLGAFYFENGAASFNNWCEIRMAAGAYEKKSLGILMNGSQLGLQARLAVSDGVVRSVYLDSNGARVSHSLAHHELNISANALTVWRLTSEGSASQITIKLFADDQLLGVHRMVPPQAGWAGFVLDGPQLSNLDGRRFYDFADAEFIPNNARGSLALGAMAVSGELTGKMRLAASLQLGGFDLNASAAVSLSAAGSAVLGGVTVLGHVNTGMQARGQITMGGMAISGGVALSDFYSLLPPNASDLEKAIEQVIARRFSEIEVAADKIPDLWNPWRCPVAWLETLADAVSVDVWSNKWTDETKRQVIAVSIAVHRIKGTVAAVREALKAAGLGGAKIIEGAESSLKYDGSQKYDGAVQYGGASSQWAQFDVVLTKPVSAEQAALARLLVEAVAPARCELREIRYQEARIYDGTYQYDGEINYQPITVY